MHSALIFEWILQQDVPLKSLCHIIPNVCSVLMISLCVFKSFLYKFDAVTCIL